MLGERGYIPSMLGTCKNACFCICIDANIVFGPIIHYEVQISKVMCQQNCWLRQANKVQQGILGGAPSYIQLYPVRILFFNVIIR